MNYKVIISYFVGIFFPLISSSGILYTLCDKSKAEDRQYNTFLQSQGIKAAVESSGLMMAVMGISNGKTEIGINMSKLDIVPRDILLTLIYTLIICLAIFFIVFEMYALTLKVPAVYKNICGLFIYFQFIYSLITINTPPILAIFYIAILCASSIFVININKYAPMQLRSLSFILLSVI